MARKRTGLFNVEWEISLNLFSLSALMAIDFIFKMMSLVQAETGLILTGAGMTVIVISESIAFYRTMQQIGKCWNNRDRNRLDKCSLIFKAASELMVAAAAFVGAVNFIGLTAGISFILEAGAFVAAVPWILPICTGLALLFLLTANLCSHYSNTARNALANDFEEKGLASIMKTSLSFVGLGCTAAGIFLMIGISGGFSALALTVAAVAITVFVTLEADEPRPVRRSHDLELPLTLVPQGTSGTPLDFTPPMTPGSGYNQGLGASPGPGLTGSESD